MFIQAAQLLSTAVFALDTEEDIATIERLVIDPQRGTIVALGVKPHGWFSKERLVAQSDIVEVNQHGIAVHNSEQLVEISELIRAVQILNQKIPVIGQIAKTESGARLGQIDDLLVDLDSWTITKYYVRQLMNERILLAEHVHSMTPSAIIFLDQVNEPDTAAQTEAATV